MKAAWETSANVATVVACLFVIGLAGPILKERWAGPQVARTARSAPVQPVTNLRVALPAANVKGDLRASVVIIEFSDFQCPFCGRYTREVSADIQKQFVDTGQVRYAFRNYPLTQIHPFALKAAQAALCAGEQRQFWAMHDLMFLHQESLDPSHLTMYAKQVGLDQGHFSECLERRRTDNLEADMAEARQAGITSTPTFLIGTMGSDGKVLVSTKIQGAQPFAVFRKIVDETVNASGS